MNSHSNFTYSFPKLKITLIPTMTRSNRFWFISLIAHTAPPMPECHNSCMWHRPTCGEAHIQKLLALLNHSFWGVHIAGRKHSLTTSWGAHITGRNWAFSSAVEKSSRHCPGIEYQPKRGHTSHILCRIQKNSPCQRCIKICWDIIFQQGEWHEDGTKWQDKC